MNKPFIKRYPIIIELKKNNPKDHARVTYISLYEQVKKYKEGLKQILTEPNKNDIRHEDIKAICIVSEFTSTDGSLKISIDNNEFKKLRDDNTYVYTYAQLLENAKNMYKEFIDIVKRRKIIPSLS
ncbi:hypothetical protein [Campylobacter sp. 7477a]|uniref:hypothetical protein n=1 Tax=Campylobacter sp. 7477a TaxID=2735741 RepID=UPI003014E36B|nr:hypothetical protein [Campylobacter sp. 7477a]